MKKYQVSFDQEFVEVMKGCGDDKRPKGWINKEILKAYKDLFDLGFAHSVEVWDSQQNLVGGLYGVEVNGLFAGESMLGSLSMTMTERITCSMLRAGFHLSSAFSC